MHNNGHSLQKRQIIKKNHLACTTKNILELVKIKPTRYKTGSSITEDLTDIYRNTIRT